MALEDGEARLLSVALAPSQVPSRRTQQVESRRVDLLGTLRRPWVVTVVIHQRQLSGDEYHLHPLPRHVLAAKAYDELKLEDEIVTLRGRNAM